MPQLEHRHDLAQQPAPPHDAAAGAGAVGFAHVVDGGERRRHERERDHDDQPELVERAAASTRTSSECDTTALNAPNTRHHADDGEALGQRLQHDRQLDGAADGEAAEQLRQREVRAS